MKKLILFFAIIASFSVNAQSIKDALFSGKLKNDSGSVIRKGDDLSTKIDTAKKKPVEQEKAKATTVVTIGGDSMQVATGTAVDSPAATTETIGAVSGSAAAGPRDNNKIWKDYIDSLASELKTEVLPNKKIKSGTYYVFVEYEIGVDGQVSVNNVSPSPESSFLAEQVKERIILTAPKMTPVLYNGKPRKSVKKNTFTITKE